MSKNDQILKTVPGPTPNNSFKDKGASENSHGGKRKGAGRKASAIKTVVKRVPSILVPMIDKMTENMMQTLANSAVIKKP